MLNTSIFKKDPSDRQGTTNSDRVAQVWPSRTNPTLAWLANHTCDEPNIENIFFELCKRLQAQGVPITRASIFLQIDHPQWWSLQVLWWYGMNQPKALLLRHGATTEDPLEERSLKATRCNREFRVRLDGLCKADQAKELSEHMQRESLTDYVAWPLQFTLGKRHSISFATNRPFGFNDDDLLDLAELLPVLSSITEIRIKDRLARDLLDTYVGQHAGEAILAGATRRGDGLTVEAAVMMIDLRGFTSICEQWCRNDLINMLNEYFDAVSAPIERHGGEILKFMGDGLLAMFPDDAAAAGRAVLDICEAMASLNAVRETTGAGPLEFGVGVDYGDVTYGNIGSRNRFDFTAIGPAVNVAGRLEELTKVIGRCALFSGAFVAKVDDSVPLQCFGEFGLRGVRRPIEVYGFCAAAERLDDVVCFRGKGHSTDFGSAQGTADER